MSAPFPPAAVAVATDAVEQGTREYRAAQNAEDDAIMRNLVAKPKLAAVPERQTTDPPPPNRLYDGVAWLEKTAHDIGAVWGTGDQVLWSSGEPFYLCGVPGAGKTTLALQIIESRIGLRSELLDMAITPTSSRVLYLAMDRPKQAARLLRRIYSDDDAEQWRDRLVVHDGPPPFDLTKEPDKLYLYAAEVGADTVIVDSLKDLASDLSDGTIGAQLNTAFQYCVSGGVEVLVLHHPRKGEKPSSKPEGLADMYGAAWLGAGAGSVAFLVVKESGDEIATIKHVKQPAEPVNIGIIHDHDTGRSRRDREGEWNPVAWLRNRGTPGTVAEGTTARLGRVGDKSETQRTRRILDGLVNSGTLRKLEAGSRGGSGGGAEGARYDLPNEAA